MAKGFYISKLLAVVGILFCVAAVATIIALAVVYAEEKAKNENLSTLITTKAPTNAPATSASTHAPAPSASTHAPAPSASTHAPAPSASTHAPAPSASTHAPATSTSTHAATTPVPNVPWKKYRLPKDLIPHHYELELQPHLDKDPSGLYIFNGNSTVHFTCVNPTDHIIIHSKKLNYTMTPVLTTEDGTAPPRTVRQWVEVEHQYLVLELEGYLQAGKKYSLSTEFYGELADDLAGFYRSEYKEGNETRVIATTQMQAPDARKAFPCFDEPAMKATFDITLVHKPNFVALSNMANISTSTRVEGGVTWTVTKFNTTLKMSTYLLAFIVCDFDYTESDKPDQKYQVRIWARKKAIEEKQGEYAMNVTGPILEFFEDYYGVPYPLPKSDQIALPDFNAGAMENWGLVTYRETALLYDPAVSSIGNKERVVAVIAHELAHQWFGNLVTVRWWNDLWLNEGFASYVEYLGADHAEKSWNIKDLMVLNDVHRVMAVDALASSHPLTSKEEEINSPAQISELFDSITYSKGASVIRMLSGFLNETVFVKGLTSYLKEFEFDSTDYNDLWTHLQLAVDNNSVVLPTTVKEIMDRWVLQMGFPVVTVNTATGEVNQKHFLLDPDSTVDRPSDFNYEWIVAITAMKPQATQNTHWLRNKTEIVDAFKTNGSEWLLVNLDVIGYYRVNYDQGNWDRLLEQLSQNHNAIPLINRAQIIDDAFNLARAKYILTTSALATTKFLAKETEYMPWEAALSSLSYFTLMFDRSEVYGPMTRYLHNQVLPLYEHFERETANFTVTPPGLTVQYNEINAISTACTYGVSKCWKLASDLFNQWIANPSVNPIEPNLRSTIYCNAIARGGVREWNFAWARFKEATVATEADKLRSAMACSREPWILNRYLSYTLDGSGEIRKQDATSTINSIGSNVAGQSLAWDFIRANWETIFSGYGGGSFSFSGLINSITRRFSTEHELKQLEQFKKDNEHIGFGSGTRALEQALEKTRANIKWVKENSQAVQSWFEAEAPISS